MTQILNKSSITSRYTLPDQRQMNYSVESNESATEYMTTSFKKVRTTQREYAIPGEEIEQTLVLTNESARQIDNIRISDTISPDATFKTGSMTINDVAYDSFTPDNYTLPNSISPQGSVTVKYTIVVIDSPATDLVSIISDITYDVAEVTDLEEKSNKIEIQITENEITVELTSSKTAVISGQKLMFQNVITNKGSVTNTNVMFKEPIPDGTQFVPGSVKIDDVVKADYNPAVGFELDDMDPAKVITVTFEVTVD